MAGLGKQLREVGPALTSSIGSFRSHTSSLDPITDFREKPIGEAVAWIVRTSADPVPASSLWGPSRSLGNVLNSTDQFALGHKWDVEVFVLGVSEKNPQINWRKVYSCLDSPEFFVGDLRSLEVLVKLQIAAFKVCV